MNTASIQKEKILFWSFATMLSFCIIFYIYCVTSTIKTVVAIEDFQTQENELLLSLGQKEFDIINLKNSVSLSYAESRGFVPTESQVYITKKSVGFLPQSHNEI